MICVREVARYLHDLVDAGQLERVAKLQENDLDGACVDILY